jgi:hypothetical protein
VEAQYPELSRARILQGSLKALEMQRVAHAEALFRRYRPAEQNGRARYGRRRRDRLKQVAFFAKKGADLDGSRRDRRDEHL